MPDFRFHARNANGHTIKGQLEATDEADLRHQLHKMGLQFRRATLLGAEEGVSSVVGCKTLSPLGLKDLAFLATQISEYLQVGTTMEQTLEIIRDSHDGAAFRSVLAELRARLQRGQTFSEAIKAYEDAFDPLFVTLARAGEEAGKLATLMHYASGYYRWVADFRFRARQKLRPAVTTLIIVYLIFAATLPGISAKLTAITIPLILYGVWRIMPSLRFFTDRFFLRIPGVGRLITSYDMAQFAYLFAQLYRAGISVPDSLRQGRDIMKNTVLQMRIDDVARDVENGKSLYDAFRADGMMPHLVMKTFRIGEETGNFDASLDILTKFYSDDVVDAVFYLSELLRTVALIIGGFLVLNIGLMARNGFGIQ